MNAGRKRSGMVERGIGVMRHDTLSDTFKGPDQTSLARRRVA